jgi:hypothetical protein
MIKTCVTHFLLTARLLLYLVYGEVAGMAGSLLSSCYFFEKYKKFLFFWGRLEGSRMGVRAVWLWKVCVACCPLENITWPILCRLPPKTGGFLAPHFIYKREKKCCGAHVRVCESNLRIRAVRSTRQISLRKATRNTRSFKAIFDAKKSNESNGKERVESVS